MLVLLRQSKNRQAIYDNVHKVIDNTSKAFDYAKENATPYSTARVIGRAVTATLTGLGPLATVGDVTYGIEKGHTSFQSQLESVFYGRD